LVCFQDGTAIHDYDRKGMVKNMNCFMCKGILEDKLTTFMVDIENCIVIVKNVPSKVCCQCEETFYSDEVMGKLEQIVNTLRNALTEIAVVNYQERVA